MMNFFFGAPIQGHREWGTHTDFYTTIIQSIKSFGHNVLTEHTTGQTRSATHQKLEQAIGPLPEDDYQSRVFVRNKMIDMLESDDLSGVIFEVSAPSLGTGVEIAHAYLREQLGLRPVPILALYQKDYWPNNLSSMVRGIPTDQYPYFKLYEYEDNEMLEIIVESFVQFCEELEPKETD